MVNMTAAKLAEKIGAEFTGQDRPLTNAAVDSRAVGEGTLFFAFQGQKNDGRDFIPAVWQAGGVAVCDRPVEGNGPLLRVENVQQALIAAAEVCRGEYDLPIVAVTGSVGKTTTKEMIASVVSCFCETAKTPGNYNNHIGLPLTLMGIGPHHRAAVIEMGMSGFGEIELLSRITRPSVGVITNVGVAHIEKLGSRENILKAKLEILRGIPPHGTLVLNADEPLLWQMKGLLPVNTLYFGCTNPHADVTGRLLESRSDGSRIAICTPQGEVEVELRVPGEHQLMNALAAFCAGTVLGIPQGDILRGLTHFEGVAMRQQRRQYKGVTLIDDCYNANTDSVLAALALLKDLPCDGQRIAVLGDMAELGELAPEAHRRVGQRAAECARCLLGVGEQMRHAVTQFGPAGVWFETKTAAADYLAAIARAGDVILFKGGRFMRMEDVMDAFTERWQG